MNKSTATTSQLTKLTQDFNARKSTGNYNGAPFGMKDTNRGISVLT